MVSKVYCTPEYTRAHEKCDTVRVTVVDTVKVFKPVPLSDDVVGSVNVWLPLVQGEVCSAINDSISASPSAHVRVPIHVKTYTDSLTYKAQVSGFMTSLDYIETFPRTEYVYVTPKKKRWGVGVQCGVTYMGRVQPYVGVGVSYDVWRW